MLESIGLGLVAGLFGWLGYCLARAAWDWWKWRD